MPMYDRACGSCGLIVRDCYEPMAMPPCTCHCGAPLVRTILPGKAHAVIGDEIDVVIKHGLCDAVTGEPVRYRSRAVMAKEAERRGLTNRVEHLGADGSDKSRKTSRWV